jgi:hypothetical protein
MYLRLAFWTLSIAYTSVLLSRGPGSSSPRIMISAALLGALLGFALGGMFVRYTQASLSAVFIASSAEPAFPLENRNSVPNSRSFKASDWSEPTQNRSNPCNPKSVTPRLSTGLLRA